MNNESQNPTQTTADNSEYAVQTVSEESGFDDQLGQAATPTPTVEAVEPKPEPSETETNEDAGEKSEAENEEMVAPNNVHVNMNVNLRLKPFKVIERKGNAITIVPKRMSRIDEVAGAWDTGDGSKLNQDDMLFVEAFREGVSAQLSASYIKDADGNIIGFYDRILNDPNSKWQQGVETPNGEVIYGRRPNLKTSPERRKITGAFARERNMRSLGLGLGNRKPLPHTGIHIEMAPRSTNDYLTLDAQLLQDKINSGRESLGLIFQNSQASQVKIVWEFIKRSIKSANVQNFSKDTDDVDLGDVIRCTDLPVLYWAQVCTMFPDGYPLDLPCSSGINICKHIERVLFDVDKGLWVNTAKLSTTQIERLNNSGHQMSDNDLENYQNNSISPLTRELKVNADTSIILEIPSINKYLESGLSWMAELTARTEELFRGDKSDSTLIANHINDSIERSVIREYSHWVREIVYYGTDVVDKAEDIADCLADMSTYSENMSMDVMGEIQKFIEDSTVAIIAIPNFACPICEKDHVNAEHSEHPDLIPLDMLRHFFMVKDLRVNIPMVR